MDTAHFQFLLHMNYGRRGKMSHTVERHLAVDQPLKKKTYPWFAEMYNTNILWWLGWRSSSAWITLRLRWIKLVIQWTHSIRISTEMSQTIPAAQPSSQLYIWMLSLFQRGFFPWNSARDRFSCVRLWINDRKVEYAAGVVWKVLMDVSGTFSCVPVACLILQTTIWYGETL